MKDTTIGKAEVLEYTDEGYYILVLRKDVLADPYYLDTYYDQLVGLLKRDDFKTDVAAKAAASGVKANSWAVRDYDQKKIVIEATSSAS